MTRTKFYEHCGSQVGAIWSAMAPSEGRTYNIEDMRALASDLTLIANNINELCSIAEMEGLGDGN